jgi:hypothetical protein
MRLRIRWPQGTVFRPVVLDVEQRHGIRCGGVLHVCSRRTRRIRTLQGPTELCCRLKRCADPACPSRPGTLSPQAELPFALPGWLIAWDVFCFIGHRRFARHWSVPQIQAELKDTYRIHLSQDAVSLYLRRYQAMLAARQRGPEMLRLAYRDIPVLGLSSDGLQPDKGHEARYAVRELGAGRVWFAEALLSSSAAEVRRLLARAKEMARGLGKPVRLWVSDKQDAFVKAIRTEFEGVPQRYCSNHFLRPLARPTLAADSNAKVPMRKKVRGLRGVERRVLHAGQAAPEAGGEPDAAGGVVLGYCGGVRGIRNDDQGGPLHPAGLRMAAALVEVRASLGRALALGQPGPAHGQLARLAGYVDQGWAAVAEQQDQSREQVEAIKAVAKALGPEAAGIAQRRAAFGRLAQRYQGEGGECSTRLAKVMRAWEPGLFVAVRGKGGAEAPWDNLELERWFRRPTGHGRRIHGRRHAGVRIVQGGPTTLLALDAHRVHPEPFCALDLLPYRNAKGPTDQTEAIERRKVMRKARSPKNGRSSSRS